MQRPYNFSAGPATLPESVLHKAAAEMLDWQGSGMGVMEMSHRGKHFGQILEKTLLDIREVLQVPADFEILFLQGGGSGENAIVPMNLCGGGQLIKAIDFVITGAWSHKSAIEAQKYASVNLAFDGRLHDFRTVAAPSDWQLSDDACYVHVCSNETIHGVELAPLPDLKALGCSAPLVVDCSSHIASRPMEWDKIGVAYAGAQKNIGPAGVTLVFVRKHLLNLAMDICPSAFHFQGQAANASMSNTPPTYGIYMAGLVFDWIKGQGGIASIEAINIAKAQLLYDTIDQSSLYKNHVDPAFRSRMNVPFLLNDESLNAEFLAQAEAVNLLSLKGHKSVGGMRASIYNAMPLAGVEALVEFMREFERKH
jgi:phosphoserine aminotransferase